MTIHTFNSDQLLLQERQTINRLRDYMYSRVDDAVVGEFVIYQSYRMICIAPDTNRGPFWAVESLPCSFTLKHGENFPIPNAWIYGVCNRIYRDEQVIRFTILDDELVNYLRKPGNIWEHWSGREILISLQDLGRYSITSNDGSEFLPPVRISRVQKDELN